MPPSLFPHCFPSFPLVFPLWLSYGAQCRSTGALGLRHYTYVKCIVPSYDTLSWGEVEKPCPPCFLFPSSLLISSPPLFVATTSVVVPPLVTLLSSSLPPLPYPIEVRCHILCSFLFLARFIIFACRLP